MTWQRGTVRAGTRQQLRAVSSCAAVFALVMVMITQSSYTSRPEAPVVWAATAEGAAAEAVPTDAPEIPAADERAEDMARVIYGTALYCSEEAQEAVLWCILNRVESPLYPDTVTAVCRQSSQWIGWSEENPVIDRIYELACEVLAEWESGGHRPIPEGCLWFDLDGAGGIVLRTKFEGGGNTWAVE